MSFLFYDLIFLVISCIAVALFLYKRRKKLKIESKILLLYRTGFGIRVINNVSKRFKKQLYWIGYLSIGLGYLLMAASVAMIIQLGIIVFSKPEVIGVVKIPPLMPLIPYLPEIFKVDFLPPFYFTYWIVVIAMIAIPHEFFHGIFARKNDIKIKSTGFGFLGPFLAAFVEPDEKEMAKKSFKSQTEILTAGSFANVLMTIIIGMIMIIFFMISFNPVGVVFNGYSSAIVNIDTLSRNNKSILDFNQTELTDLRNKSDLNIKLDGNSLNLLKVEQGEKVFFVTPNNLIDSINNNNKYIIAFLDMPALKNGVVGAITHIDDNRILSMEDLSSSLSKKIPGDKVKIKTKIKDKFKEYEIILEADPYNSSRGVLGVVFISQEDKGVFAKVRKIVTFYKKPFVYYEPIGNSDFIIFFYNLLWWIVLISLSVAIVNMLPLGIFDGGRVFYISILKLTGSEKTTSKIFKIVTILFLIFFVFLTIFWFIKG